MTSKKKTAKRANLIRDEVADLSKFAISRKEVSIDGNVLPLAIGDKILVNDQDHLVKTITSIQIYEDGRVGYLLEWFDSSDSSFKTECVTSTELAFLSRAKKERNPIKAFSQDC